MLLGSVIAIVGVELYPEPGCHILICVILPSSTLALAFAISAYALTPPPLNTSLGSITYSVVESSAEAILAPYTLSHPEEPPLFLRTVAILVPELYASIYAY